MAKEGWFQENHKDEKGILRLYYVFYEDGKIRSKTLVDKRKKQKKKDISKTFTEVFYGEQQVPSFEAPKPSIKMTKDQMEIRNMMWNTWKQYGYTDEEAMRVVKKHYPDYFP